MLPRNLPLLEKLAANSALFALLIIGASELMALLLRLLPAPLRPARAWASTENAVDLDERREPSCPRENRRTSRRDRRRNMTFAPRGFNAFSRSDRRTIARGRRTSDWRYS